MPRFVILHHEMPPGAARATHWDLMLEPPNDATTGDENRALWTWALDEEPRAECTIAATRLADHRAAYLDYEGEISGGRGTVSRWDAGDYAYAAALEKVLDEPEELILLLSGQRIMGSVRLLQLKTAGDRWTCSYFANAVHQNTDLPELNEPQRRKDAKNS